MKLFITFFVFYSIQTIIFIAIGIYFFDNSILELLICFGPKKNSIASLINYELCGMIPSYKDMKLKILTQNLRVSVQIFNECRQNKVDSIDFEKHPIINISQDANRISRKDHVDKLKREQISQVYIIRRRVLRKPFL